MRIFFDFEFIENGDKHPIIPVSIGMVREDGETYYAEFTDVDWSLANSWVKENVKPFLGRVPAKNKVIIADEIHTFVGDAPEFWAYYADYDWVLLCQQYGRMVDIPEDWPLFCLDLKQYMWHLGVSREDLPDQRDEHYALADAQWNLEVFKFLLTRQKELFGLEESV